MGYINDSLSNGEEVKEVFKLHWFSKIPMIIWAILAIPTLGITLLLVIWEWLKLRSIEQGGNKQEGYPQKGNHQSKIRRNENCIHRNS